MSIVFNQREAPDIQTTEPVVFKDSDGRYFFRFSDGYTVEVVRESNNLWDHLLGKEMIDQIKTQYVVTCQRCSSTRTVERETKNEAIQEYHLAGWRPRESKGWYCERCVRAEK